MGFFWQLIIGRVYLTDLISFLYIWLLVVYKSSDSCKFIKLYGKSVGGVGCVSTKWMWETKVNGKTY